MSAPLALASILVLWRQPDTMALFGIPYEMREGQSPSDLTKGSPTLPYGTYGTPARAPGPRDDWQWLGSPGWWGHLTSEEQTSIEDFLAEHYDLVPRWPNEWATLTK